MSGHTRRRSSRSARGASGALTAAVVLLVLLAGVGQWIAASTYHRHWVTCTVLDKDRGYHDGSSHYRIYTDTCDTLSDVDSWWNGKHNSSNLYAQIQVGRRYQFLVVGFRSGIGSHFANILDVRDVPA